VSVRIELPPDMPVWVVITVLLVMIIGVLAFALNRAINRVFPVHTGQRLAWWQSFWKQRAEAKAARRKWRAQVRRERYERCKERRIAKAAVKMETSVKAPESPDPSNEVV
jgi:hypothetical protein